MRSAYNRFLTKFPLFFGYWKKYADLEFSIAGTEAAEMVTKFKEETNFPLDLRTWCCQYPKQR